MKSETLELPVLKPKTAQYLAMKSIEEQKTVFEVFVELADKRAAMLSIGDGGEHVPGHYAGADVLNGRVDG